MSEALRLGTRGSRLALWQAYRVKALLDDVHPGIVVEIIEVKTSGDRIKDAPLGSPGTIGFFTKEIEQALFENHIDLAVHSLKDLPTTLVPGLTLAAVPERADTRDALIGRSGVVGGLSDLAPGMRVATSSPRRRGQLLAAFPGLEVEPIRGNVPTRIAAAKKEGGPDAVLLAMAGLMRLELGEHVTAPIPHETMLPAPGQGALGIETREDDARVIELLRPLQDPHARLAVTAERSFLHRLEGGCTVPAGALARIAEGDEIVLDGVVVDLDGRSIYRGTRRGTDADLLGRELAEALLAEGADQVLAGLREDG
jgi:hydroxymethylbilane synthase